MYEFLAALLGGGAGLALGWWLARAGGAAGQRSAERELAASAAALAETRGQVQQREASLSAATADLQSEQRARVAAETRAAEIEKQAAEQKRLLQEAEQRLREAFEALSARALRDNNEQFARQAAEQIKPLNEALERYRSELRELEGRRQTSYGELMQKLQELTTTQQLLSRNATELSTALRAPQVKGRWGEITLRRAVEAAGLNPYCDFVEQESLRDGDGGGLLRPDMIVRLPGERTIVVDAKAPTSAYLDAVEATSEAERTAALENHARAIRQHMLALSAKSYWRQFEARSPEFVIMFVPGEAFFSAALEQNRGLLEEGVQSRVILASPTTLIALLQAVGYGWQQQERIHNAEELVRTAHELWQRICVFAEHFGAIGKNLGEATGAFNRAIGSWEARVLPQGRRIAELGVRVNNEKSAAVPAVEVQPRSLPESLVQVLPPKPEQAELGFDTPAR